MLGEQRKPHVESDQGIARAHCLAFGDVRLDLLALQGDRIQADMQEAFRLGLRWFAV